MNRLCAVLFTLSLPLSAADRVFTGALERVTHTAISIRLADGLAVSAALPPGIAVLFEVADQVRMVCTEIDMVYDAPAALHYRLRLKSVGLVRAALPEERAEMAARLSWQRGENLLKLPALLQGSPPAAATQPDLERVRQVNLDYADKMPNFVADEVIRYYRSSDTGKPRRLDKTIEDEIAVKDHDLTHQNVRINGKPSKLEKFGSADFGLQVGNLFDPKCSNRIGFVGSTRAGGRDLLIFLFQAPAGGCFGDIFLSRAGGPDTPYNPIRTGRVLIDAAGGNVVRYEEEAAGFPESSGADRFTLVDSWEYVTIGASSYLVPTSAEYTFRGSGGDATKTSTQYKNHRHFEASIGITFDKGK